MRHEGASSLFSLKKNVSGRTHTAQMCFTKVVGISNIYIVYKITDYMKSRVLSSGVLVLLSKQTISTVGLSGDINNTFITSLVSSLCRTY